MNKIEKAREALHEIDVTLRVTLQHMSPDQPSIRKGLIDAVGQVRKVRDEIDEAEALRAERDRLREALETTTETLDKLRAEYCYKDPIITARVVDNRALLETDHE